MKPIGSCMVAFGFTMLLGCGGLTSKDDPSLLTVATGKILFVEETPVPPAVFLVPQRGGTPVRTRAKADGSFVFHDIPVGTYSLVINDLSGHGALTEVTLNGGGENKLGELNLEPLRDIEGITGIHGVAFEERISDAAGNLEHICYLSDGSAAYAWQRKRRSLVPDVVRVDLATGEINVVVPGNPDRGLRHDCITQGLDLTMDGRYLLVDQIHEGWTFLAAHDLTTGQEVILERSETCGKDYYIFQGSDYPAYEYRDGHLDMLCQKGFLDERELWLISCDLSAETGPDGRCVTTAFPVPDSTSAFLDQTNWFLWTKTHLLIVLDLGMLYSLDRRTDRSKLIDNVSYCQADGCEDLGVLGLGADRVDNVYYATGYRDEKGKSVLIRQANLLQGVPQTLINLTDILGEKEGENVVVPVEGPTIVTTEDGSAIAFAVEDGGGISLIRLGTQDLSSTIVRLIQVLAPVDKEPHGMRVDYSRLIRFGFNAPHNTLTATFAGVGRESPFTEALLELELTAEQELPSFWQSLHVPTTEEIHPTWVHQSSGMRVAQAEDQAGFLQYYIFDNQGEPKVPLTFLRTDHLYSSLPAGSKYLYYCSLDSRSGYEQLYRVDLDLILELWGGS